MTTFNLAAVADTVIAFKKGVTLQLLRYLRDNPIAIAEADASVPNALRQTVILGTINTTSGTTQTLSGLDLTPFRFLRVTFDKVRVSTGGAVSLGGVQVGSNPGAVVGDGYVGTVTIDLSNGCGSGALAVITTTPGSAPVNPFAFFCSLSNASTSVSVSCITSFTAGAVTFYGEK